VNVEAFNDPDRIYSWPKSRNYEVVKGIFVEATVGEGPVSQRVHEGGGGISNEESREGRNMATVGGGTAVGQGVIPDVVNGVATDSSILATDVNVLNDRNEADGESHKNALVNNEESSKGGNVANGGDVVELVSKGLGDDYQGREEGDWEIVGLDGGRRNEDTE